MTAPPGTRRSFASRISQRWRSRPLRVRLVALFSALLAIALASVGTFALTLLQGSLTSELDQQLTAATDTLVTSGISQIPTSGSNPLAPSDYVVVLAEPDGSVQGVYRDGTMLAFPLTSDGPPEIGDLDLESVNARAGEPYTVGSEWGPRTWRVTTGALTTLDGSVRYTVAVALPLDGISSTMRHMAVWLVVVSVGVLTVAGTAGYLLVRGSLRPLQEIERTASSIAAGDLSQRVETAPESTEVGSLATSLNTMLGTLESSFAAQAASEQRMRRFVGDASHELRTPLATVRGYAELHRLGGVPPEEVSGVMARIESSATRMGRLVEDLLALARLDQGQELRRAEISVLELLTESAADLRALDPSRAVTVEAPESLTVTADPDRLRQVITNLVGNAAAYTPAGSPVELVAGSWRGGVLIEVRDHGPGIAPADAERIFERFARLDEGRSRDEGGSGLGLAIAAAITGAHGGAIRCVPTPGSGATMQVWMP